MKTFPAIDNSMLTTYSTCPQKFFARYVLGLVHQGTSTNAITPLVFGSAVHECLQILYDTGLEAAKTHGTSLLEDKEDNGPRSLHLLSCILEYVDEVIKRPGESNYTLIGQEDNFVVDAGLPALYCGRIDQKLIDRFTGDRIISDWKTTSVFSNNYFANIEKDPQILGYLIADEIMSGAQPVGQIITLRVGKDTWYEKYKRGDKQGMYKNVCHMVSPRVHLRTSAKEDWLWFTKRVMAMIEVNIIESLGRRALETPIEELREGIISDIANGSDIWKYWTQFRHNCTKWGRMCQFHQLCIRRWHPNAIQEYVQDEWTPWEAAL